MALPPEPLDEVLPLATWVVSAHVAEVSPKSSETSSSDPVPPGRGQTGMGPPASAQRVRLVTVAQGEAERTRTLASAQAEAIQKVNEAIARGGDAYPVTGACEVGVRGADGGQD